ncbi:MAG: hypothetical protein DYG94_12980 [Leptolyngbya sp. PLA3]|nr:MAG: hypothetical protein EDM82_03155 [Cyanobacteria bacterium CYA]MCE7969639.1 hypothetical protein [Leptolyngbya sp. PL-A3]
MKPAPKPIKMLTLLAGVISTLLAIGGVATALFAAESPIWGMLSFEVVLFVASALAIVTGLGKFDQGFGLATATLGASIIGAAVLGTLDARTNLSSAGSPLAKYVTPVLGVRLLLGAGLACLAGMAVLARRPVEWKRFLLGSVLTAPVLLLGAAIALGKASWLLHEREGSSELLRVSGLLVGGVLAIVLLSAGGHLLITAFERCHDDARSGRA